MITTAMILAAGKGQRMLPLSLNCPKPLLTIGRRPLIVYHIEALASSGVSKIIINLHHLGEQIKQLLGNGSSFGVQILYSEEATLLETGGGIVKALPDLGSSPFIVVSADIWSDYNFAWLNKFLDDSGDDPASLAHCVLVANPVYHLQGDFGLSGRFLTLSAAQKFTYANIGVFQPQFFQAAPSSTFPLNILLRQAIAARKVTGELYQGRWHNIGTPSDLKIANNYFEHAKIV